VARPQKRAILAELEQLGQTKHVEGITTLQLCSAPKDHAALMRWLEHAHQDRSPCISTRRWPGPFTAITPK
jgi:hypothetical protein